MHATDGTSRMTLSRAAGIAFGVGTQVLFAAAVWQLFWFLEGGGSPIRRGMLWLDPLLAIQFAAPHSLLLLPAVRGRLRQWISDEFYPLAYCAVSSITLLITISCWRTSEAVFWDLHGAAAGAIRIGFYACWAALIYSLSLTGLGSQNGLPQWLRWLRRQPPARAEFAPRGAYRWLRHPVYLSFAGLIWLTPRMSLDHAILTGLWSAYIFAGSLLKDRRLTFYLGDVYRAYQQRVPGFPLVPFGPLARRPAEPAGAAPSAKFPPPFSRRDAA